MRPRLISYLLTGTIVVCDFVPFVELAHPESRNDESIRADFLNQVTRLNDVPSRKHHWADIYIQLTKYIRDVEQLRTEFESKQQESQTQKHLLRSLRVSVSVLDKRIENAQTLQQLAVRQFTALQGLEDLDRLQEQSPKPHYHEQKRLLEEEIRWIEQVRLLHNFYTDIAEALQEIRKELIELGTSVRISAPIR